MRAFVFAFIFVWLSAVGAWADETPEPLPNSVHDGGLIMSLVVAEPSQGRTFQPGTLDLAIQRRDVSGTSRIACFDAVRDANWTVVGPNGKVAQRPLKSVYDAYLVISHRFTTCDANVVPYTIHYYVPLKAMFYMPSDGVATYLVTMRFKDSAGFGDITLPTVSVRM